MRRGLRLVDVLFAAPFVFLIAYGSYALWMSGWGSWAWWLMAACFALAHILARLGV